ncbi:MAG: ABC transporter ATP-binding protein, partial [Lachnospiraceae bacterium]|nr:ABC transporter ATP-binding protein [Lachnospiraceae bacterium]
MAENKENKQKNTYREDEAYEENFNIRHLLLAGAYIKKYLKYMIFAMVFSAIAGITSLASPTITRKVLDEAVPNKDMKQLCILVGILVGVYILTVIFATIRSKTMVNVSQNIIYDIRKDLFAHLQKLPFQYYDDRPHGKILIRVVNYVNSVS